jgi:hypothetical protein
MPSVTYAECHNAEWHYAHGHLGVIVLTVSKMEKHAFKNVNNCWNTNISFYLKTSCGQSSNLDLSVVHFFNTSVN